MSKYNPKAKVTVEVSFTDGKKECLKDVNICPNPIEFSSKQIQFVDVNNNLIVFPLYNVKWYIIKH